MRHGRESSVRHGRESSARHGRESSARVVGRRQLGPDSERGWKAVDAVLGSRYPAPLEATQAAAQVASAPDEPCGPRAKSFVACMTDEANGGELEACRYYLDSLQACRRQSAGGGSEMQ